MFVRAGRGGERSVLRGKKPEARSLEASLQSGEGASQLTVAAGTVGVSRQGEGSAEESDKTCRWRCCFLSKTR